MFIEETAPLVHIRTLFGPLLPLSERMQLLNGPYFPLFRHHGIPYDETLPALYRSHAHSNFFTIISKNAHARVSNEVDIIFRKSYQKYLVPTSPGSFVNHLYCFSCLQK